MKQKIYGSLKITLEDDKTSESFLRFREANRREIKSMTDVYVFKEGRWKTHKICECIFDRKKSCSPRTSSRSLGAVFGAQNEIKQNFQVYRIASPTLAELVKNQ